MLILSCPNVFVGFCQNLRHGLGRREKWPQKIGRKEKGRENQHEKGEGRMS